MLVYFLPSSAKHSIPFGESSFVWSLMHAKYLGWCPAHSKPSTKVCHDTFVNTALDYSSLWILA